jgi:hypothetical protein
MSASIKVTATPSDDSNEISNLSPSSLAKLSLAPASYTQLTLTIKDLTTFDTLSLASISSLLRKDVESNVHLRVNPEQNASNLHTAILLAGLTAQSERMDDSAEQKYRVITTSYKPPTMNTAAKINLPKGVNDVVKINIDLDDDMVDEDDLLNDAGGLNAPPEVDMDARAKSDCDGRKPCDDCTCGRREEWEAEQNGEEKQPERKVIKDFKSNCGNCAKGDAFRCAGCPFLGKPAFKEGEEHLVLDLTDDL